jgi:threonine/homoserine/homoserine lactone efflux protein
MKAVFVAILPFAVVVMVSPINVIAAILLLFTKKPIANASSYLAGFIVGVGAVLAALVALATAVDLTGGSGPSRVASIIRIVLGGYLVFAGIRKFRGRPRAGESATSPKWMAGISSFAPPKSFATGVLVGGLNPKNIAVGIAAALTITAAGLPVPQQVAVSALYVLVAILGVAAPILVVVFLGDGADAVLESWKDWLEQNSGTVMAVIFFAFGVVLLGNGIAGL